MRIYTIQTVSFYDELLQEGIVCCNTQSWMCLEYRVQYDWMAEQMRKRIGNPPRPETKYPIWVWQQYISKKNPVPPMSSKDIEEGETEAVMLELEVPDNEVLLSDFSVWHLPLNHGAVTYKHEDNKLVKELKDYERQHKDCFRVQDYSPELQKKILKTWERVFDLDTCDPNIATAKRRNRSIQGTIWLLRKEWLKTAHIFNRNSEIKRITFE